MNESRGKRPVDIGAQESTLDRPREARPASHPPKPAADAGLDRPTQGRIGDQLRAMYDELVQQPVPDRLADLIRRLESKDPG